VSSSIAIPATNPEFYWAARGSGPGFFAVVTAFHLRVYPRPAVCGSSLYVYPWEHADEIYTWARGISAEVDRRVEFQMVASRAVPAAGLETPGIVMASPVFADTEDQAVAALSILEPVRCAKRPSSQYRSRRQTWQRGMTV
jgi:hypothetical protein